MHLFINASAASAGGGVTYVRSVAPHLAARRDVRFTVLVSSDLCREFGDSGNVRFLKFPESRSGALGRIWREQRLVPALIREVGADVLLSTGNFAILRSPVPQILLSRNALYVSEDFSRDLFARRHFSLLLETKARARLAKHSIRKADCTVAPSESFAETLRRWTGCPVRSLHHGFDRSLFFGDTAVPAGMAAAMERPPNTLRMLFVSHYNYYRNFETLLRAVPLVWERTTTNVQLVLTCKLAGTPGGYRAGRAAELVRALGIQPYVLELGTVSYRQLHHLYRSCDIYVSPAYAETFAHPLVEAMACGLPVVASDLPVHREICRDAAIYFSRFSPAELADCIVQLAGSLELSESLARQGLIRSRDFSWQRHIDEILALAREVAGVRGRPEYFPACASDAGITAQEEQPQHRAV
jgi:glycosyltransferase involved in cell wall biosynthesis